MIKKKKDLIKEKEKEETGEEKIPFNQIIKPVKIDYANANYEIDNLQDVLLKMYLRADKRFRRAFSMDYTEKFFAFLEDKARLKEPIHISILGQVRSGKSYIAIVIASYLMALYGKRFTIDYITANAFEFLEKLKNMPMEKLTNTCFVIDEEKMAIWGIGSIAKKVKLTDVQNIIAIQNISTIMLNPTKWANAEAQYGIRTFGRCFRTKTVRCMLYNLQEKGSGGELPMGNLYIPIFTQVLTNAEELEKQYLAKKKTWVEQEQRGEGDVLYEIKMNSARNFCKDKTFLSIKTKTERLTYLSTKLGSEWTKSECQEILSMTNLILAGQLK